MALVPEEVVGCLSSSPWLRGGRRLSQALAASLALCCGLAAGCVTTGSLLPGRDAAPSGAVCQVVACWDNHVMYSPDPVRNGAPGPGIAGRVYLFGQEVGFPLVGDGAVVVDVYDDTHPAGPNQLPLEEWRFDKDTLKRLQRRDPIGAGYTLFLPWGTYRPDITRVRLQLSYHPAKGTPLYAPTSSVTLSGDADTAGPAMARGPIGPAGRVASK